MYNEDSIKKLIGASGKYLRNEKGLTQEKFAERVSLETVGLAQIEICRKFISADTLARLANGLEVSPAVLFTPQPKYYMNPDKDYKKEITGLLPTLSEEQLHELYNIMLVIKK